MTARRALLTAGVAVVAVLLAAEVLCFRASRRLLGNPPAQPRSEVVVALGYRDRGPRAHFVTRARVRVALRSRGTPATTVLWSGGAVGGPVPEAELMAAHAHELGYRGPELLETASRSTWDNVREAIPYLEGADRIVVASQSLHAEKARRYLWRMRPDLAARLGRAHDHRWGELTWLKPAMVARTGWLRARPRPRRRQADLAARSPVMTPPTPSR